MRTRKESLLVAVWLRYFELRSTQSLESAPRPSNAVTNTHSQSEIPVISPRLPAAKTNRTKTSPLCPDNDHSGRYGDDQWHETEAEKEAQERSEGGKISYSDVGVKRQSLWDSGITPEQTEQLRRMGGTPGKDE
jgi:hypothetical protein